MKAVKENKVYTVDETTKQQYLSQGYDITDDSGKVIETPKNKTVPYAEYEKLFVENQKLKREKT